MLLAIGAILWLIAVVGDAAHGVLMFPVLKPYSERIAIGYLAFRILDAAFISIAVLFTLLQIPIGSEFLKAAAPNTVFLQSLSTLSVQANLYAYYMAMITLGISGIMLNYIFFKSKLVPRLFSIWGLVGYTVILVGMVSAITGSGLADLSSYPGGLWEMVIGVWLVVKGFNVVPEATRRDEPVSVMQPA